MPKVGVVLSGCGVYDGAEIHESVLTLLELDKQGAEVVIMAPDIPQMHVVNHLKGEPEEGETRNVLVESARIARGNIEDIANVDPSDLDAVIFPGGFGAAKNLSNFAVKGADAEIDPLIQKFVEGALKSGKAIGFICITPAVAARILCNAGIGDVKLTIGTDIGTASAIDGLGCRHVATKVDEITVDEAKRIVSTGAYMHDASISEIARGISKLVAKVMALA